MNLFDILIFAALALVIRLAALIRGHDNTQTQIRHWAIFVVSLLAVFWLQPITPIRYLDYWLPLLTLSLVALVWWLVTPAAERRTVQNRVALSCMAALAVILPLTRLLTYNGLLTATRPPAVGQPLVWLTVLALLFGVARGKRFHKAILATAIWLILLLFLALKLPWLGEQISAALRWLNEQPLASAAAGDLRWLGFSYIAFRLLHVLRDAQHGRLKTVSLRDFVNYSLFFPALTAGPIDRLERFQADIVEPAGLSASEIGAGAERLLLGLFKKFVLADTLALFAMNALNAGQVEGTGWAWVMLYAYAFQIYLDFSGLTDIAIGLGLFLGVRLPENFNRPYLQQNLQTFWNNWHMTLTNWFRAYFFNPVTRSMRRARKVSPVMILLLTQVGTMLLIGMWHGVTWNFLIWGAWHGIGLFVQNRWSDWARSRFNRFEERPPVKRALPVFNVLLTFHYVALGWVWFALPDPHTALVYLGRLIGLE